MIIIDLHLHTSRYSSCSKLEVQQLSEMAAFLPIDGMVITDHDQQWSASELEALQTQAGDRCRFYRGVEVSCHEGHFIAIGLRENPPIYLDMPLKELSQLAKEDNAALIMTHPGRFFPVPSENPGPEWQGVDAIEVMSYNIKEELAPGVLTTLERLPRPQVAGSDGHAAWTLGMYGTMFPSLPGDEKELAQMIKEGKGVPWANEKHLKQVMEQIPEAHLLLKSPVSEN